MINNKRGLSDVITTVLIILLVLVAIVIIWAFVGPALSGSGETINYQVACQATVVKPVSCNATADNIKIELVSKGEVSLSSIVAIITTPSGDVFTNSTANVPNVFETTNIMSVGTYSVNDIVKTAATFTRDGGKTFTCPESVEKVTCVA